MRCIRKCNLALAENSPIAILVYKGTFGKDLEHFNLEGMNVVVHFCILIFHNSLAFIREVTPKVEFVTPTKHPL